MGLLWEVEMWGVGKEKLLLSETDQAVHKYNSMSNPGVSSTGWEEGEKGENNI